MREIFSICQERNVPKCFLTCAGVFHSKEPPMNYLEEQAAGEGSPTDQSSISFAFRRQDFARLSTADSVTVWPILPSAQMYGGKSETQWPTATIDDAKRLYSD